MVTISPPSNYVNLDTHNGYEVTFGRYVIQIKWTLSVKVYMLVVPLVLVTINFIYITVNGSRIGGSLHLEIFKMLMKILVYLKLIV